MFDTFISFLLEGLACFFGDVVSDKEIKKKSKVTFALFIVIIILVIIFFIIKT